MDINRAIAIVTNMVPKHAKLVNGTYKGGYGNWESEEGKAIKAVVAAAEKQTGTDWIPVSERLPEATELEAYGDEVTPVLITYLGYYDREPREGGLVIWCEDNTWRWHDETLHVNMMDVVNVEITAWMPLPEPYKAE